VYVFEPCNEFVATQNFNNVHKIALNKIKKTALLTKVRHGEDSDDKRQKEAAQ